MREHELSIGQLATLACLLEVTAPKPGNVHRGADFEDLTFGDFATSAVAIAPAMDQAHQRGVGATVRASVRATRRLVATNTNLGTALLLAPLAVVPRDQTLNEGIPAVLENLTAGDAALVYEAIRLAQPGGLGDVDEMDVQGPAPAELVAAMRAASSRDMVARQYAEGFAQVLDLVVPWLADGEDRKPSLTQRIVLAHVRLMSQFPDSLIGRKCGDEVAQHSALLASSVLESGAPGDEAYESALADFDFWLRSDHHRRNPGTTADLIAAGLFAALRDGHVQPPLK